MPPPDILLAPGPERVATTNAWAFCRRLHLPAHPAAADGPALWAALREALAADPRGGAAAFAAFAGVPAAPAQLAPRPGAEPTLILYPRAGPPRPVPSEAWTRPASDLPAGLAAALLHRWDRQRLLALRAGLLLQLDLRPDDVVLLAGHPPANWLPALIDGTRLILAEATPARLLPLAAETGATVLAAPAGWITEAAVMRGDQPGLGALRALVALGGSMAPAARARVYGWIKADVMLFARAGARYWGNPLSPVMARPAAEPALFCSGAPDPRTGGGRRGTRSGPDETDQPRA